MAWRVTLSGPALLDFDNVIQWTAAEYGTAQALKYETLIVAALRKLEAGPTTVLAQAAPNFHLVRSLPIMDGGRRTRHVLYFRADQTGVRRTIVVLRILYAAMDPTRHLPDDDPPVS